LIWLEADVLIRRRGQGRSLDDFCRRFFGGLGGSPLVKPYILEDVVATLNEVCPYDWRTFLTNRLHATGPRAPLAGIEGSGWRLIYHDVPNTSHPYRRTVESTDFRYSLGIRLSPDGTILDVFPGTHADKAGLVAGGKVTQVNGNRWSMNTLAQAVKNSKTAATPLEMRVQDGEQAKTYRLDYQDGERYPHLERDPARPDVLEQIMKPLARSPAP
jgi:predicted metalloprotease with PDZ domain